MKVVEVTADVGLSSLLADVDAGEEVVIARNGMPVARLSKITPVRRRPGALADSVAWRDFRYDPSIFKALETDAELAAEGWPS